MLNLQYANKKKTRSWLRDMILIKMLKRYWLKKRMNQKTATAFDHHPAVDCVKKYLSGHEECLILWGLSESNTLLCAQIIANGVIREKGFAKIIRCDVVARETESLRAYFLESIGCKTLDAFVKYAPENTWLIFDAIDRVLKHPDTEVFLKHLIQRSRDSAKFKLLLCVHEAKNAMALLRWADSQRRVVLVEPAGCCRWRAAHVRSHMLPQTVEDIMRAGCPFVQSNADELTARWEYGAARLTRFVENEWSLVGAVV
jgi:hypothetical protein